MLELPGARRDLAAELPLFRTSIASPVGVLSDSSLPESLERHAGPKPAIRFVFSTEECCSLLALAAARHSAIAQAQAGGKAKHDERPQEQGNIKLTMRCSDSQQRQRQLHLRCAALACSATQIS